MYIGPHDAVTPEHGHLHIIMSLESPRHDLKYVHVTWVVYIVYILYTSYTNTHYVRIISGFRIEKKTAQFPTSNGRELNAD